MKNKAKSALSDPDKKQGLKIILTGFMGCGKSSIGQRLADMLCVPFYDTDKMIETQESMKVPEIFEEKGESYFRDLEQNLVKTLQELPDCVISTGGGMPVFNDNIYILNQTGETIYLKVPLKILTQRIYADSTRPLVKNLHIKHKVYDFIKESLKIRNPYYKKSKYIIYCKDKSIEEICRELISKLNKTHQLIKNGVE